jgi:hypothetical protein
VDKGAELDDCAEVESLEDSQALPIYVTDIWLLPDNWVLILAKTYFYLVASSTI